jgi:nicotinamide phosphoribosyltransferase
MLNQYPTGPVASVGDSYNIWDHIEKTCGETLYKKIMERDGTFVVRPDTGEIALDYPEVVNRLMTKFPTNRNDKGYRILDSHISTIWGDGCTLESIKDTVINCDEEEISIDNLHFGMGGGLLQKLNRDTQRFAFKCSAAQIDGQWRDVYKDPVGHSGKASKRGRLVLHAYEDGSYETVKRSDVAAQFDQLDTVFENGELLIDQNFEDIKARTLS